MRAVRGIYRHRHPSKHFNASNRARLVRFCGSVSHQRNAYGIAGGASPERQADPIGRCDPSFTGWICRSPRARVREPRGEAAEGEAFSPIIALACKQSYPLSTAAGQKPETIVFYLVEPLRSGRRAIGRGWRQSSQKSGKKRRCHNMAAANTHMGRMSVA